MLFCLGNGLVVMVDKLGSYGLRQAIEPLLVTLVFPAALRTRHKIVEMLNNVYNYK